MEKRQVFKGEVVEKTTSPLPMPSIAAPRSGFPSFQNTKIKPRVDNSQPTQKQRNEKKSSAQETSEPCEDYEQQNLEFVKALSADELAAAVAQLPKLSRASVDFLLRREESQERTKQATSASSNSTLKATSRTFNLPKPKSLDLTRLNKDRFNLNGVKVMSKGELEEQLMAAFGASTDFDFVPTQEELVALVDLTSSTILGCGLAVGPPPPDCQPQHELHNHEFDQDKPGYNLIEISELIRSSSPQQRLLGLRMMTGVLLMRDCIVSLESYDQLPDGDTQIPTVCTASWSAVAQAISRILEASLLCMRTDSATFDVRSRVRRIVVFALLQICAADLPSELPSLLLWGINSLSSKQSGHFLVQRVALLRCLEAYMFSFPEELAAELIWDDSEACPLLITPHARRAEVCYELHANACEEKRRKAEEDTSRTDENEGEQGSSALENRPMWEQLAAQCRWNRVEVLFREDFRLMSFLSKSIADGCSVLSYFKEREESAVTDAEIVVSSEIEHSICAALIATRILSKAARNGSEALCGSIVEAIIPLWNNRQYHFLWDYVEDGTKHPLNALLQQLSRHWWKLACHLCQVCSKFATFLVKHRENPIAAASSMVSRELGPIPASVHDLLSSALWQARFLNVILRKSYVEGLTSARDLTLAVLERSSVIFLAPGSNSSNFLFGSILALWADAARICAQQLTLSGDCQGQANNSAMEPVEILARLLLEMGERLFSESALASFCSDDCKCFLEAKWLSFMASLFGFGSKSISRLGILNQIFEVGLVDSCVAYCLHRVEESKVAGSAQLEAGTVKLGVVAESLARRFPSYSITGSVCEDAVKSNGLSMCWKAELDLHKYRIALLWNIRCAGEYNDTSFDLLNGAFGACTNAVANGLFRWKTSQLVAAKVALWMDQKVSLVSERNVEIVVIAQILLYLSTLTAKLRPTVRLAMKSCLETLLKQLSIVGDRCDEISSLVVRLALGDHSPHENVNVASAGVFQTQFGTIPFNWMFSCLQKLEGYQLSVWLQCLAYYHHVLSNTHFRELEDYFPAAAQELFALLWLACPQNSFRWYSLDVDANRSEGDSTRHFVHTFEQSIDPDLELSYVELLASVFERFCQKPGNSRRFAEICYRSLSAVSNTNLFDNIQRRGGKYSRDSIIRSRSIRIESGVMDLCERLVDSCGNRCVSQLVHSCTLYIMASLYMPWRVREKLWIELTRQKLLVFFLVDKEALEPRLLNASLKLERTITLGDALLHETGELEWVRAARQAVQELLESNESLGRRLDEIVRRQLEVRSITM